MMTQKIIKKLAGTNEEASKLWQASFEPELSLIFNRVVLNPIVISDYCEKTGKYLTEKEKDILFI